MAVKKAKQRARVERKGEQGLRDRIVHAAFDAFMEHGYAGTSTLEIATRAKVSKRELYALFSSKEAMLAEGIRRRTEQMQVAPDLPEARDRKMLGEVFTAFGARLLQEVCHPHVTAVFRLAIGEAARAPEIAQILNAAGREATKKALATFLTKAQSAGLVEKGDPTAMAAQFLALLWSDRFVPLLLGVEARPDEAECQRRARSAAAQFLMLNPASADQARP
jgi:AcrR family transcriptional regulator